VRWTADLLLNYAVELHVLACGRLGNVAYVRRGGPLASWFLVNFNVTQHIPLISKPLLTLQREYAQFRKIKEAS